MLAAASGFYMIDRPDLWGRFRSTEFWWMHAMVRLWLIFTTILFLGEPLVARRQKHQPVPADPGRRLARMQWLHWALLALSSITVLAAVAGSQGICIPISTATGTFRSSLQSAARGRALTYSDNISFGAYQCFDIYGNLAERRCHGHSIQCSNQLQSRAYDTGNQ